MTTATMDRAGYARLLRTARTFKVRAVRSARAGFPKIARYYAVACRKVLCSVPGFSSYRMLALWQTAGHVITRQTQWLPHVPR